MEYQKNQTLAKLKAEGAQMMPDGGPIGAGAPGQKPWFITGYKGEVLYNMGGKYNTLGWRLVIGIMLRSTDEWTFLLWVPITVILLMCFRINTRLR
jgi:hypothetical protein